MSAFLFSKLSEFLRFLREKFVLPFRKNLKSPRFLALSTAVGVFCALLPIIGQAYICFLIWVVARRTMRFKFSLALAAAWTFLTNPLTMPFVLYGYYAVGLSILRRPSCPFSKFSEEAKSLLSHDPNFDSLLKNSFDFFVGVVGEPMAVGGIVCIALATPLSYLISYSVAVWLNRRRARNISNQKIAE